VEKRPNEERRRFLFLSKSRKKTQQGFSAQEVRHDVSRILIKQAKQYLIFIKEQCINNNKTF
jgi:hypothetical protein